MLRKYLVLLIIFASLPLLAESGQYVRIELRSNGILSLAEVEVFSGKKNIALKAKAKQSSTAHSGSASGAVDGTTSEIYKGGTMTHTNDEKSPWWEVDLGKTVKIDSIKIWNRGGSLGKRLDKFTIIVLDANRKVVFSKSKISAPDDIVHIEIKKKGKTIYLDRQGKKTSSPSVCTEEN
jgi:hypothetical protein